MLIVDKLLISGIRFVLDKVASAVEAEMNNEDVLRQELLAAQMRHELGEISDDEFAEIESSLLAALREIQERKRGQTGPREALRVGGEGTRVTGIDVSFGGDEAESEEVSVTSADMDLAAETATDSDSDSASASASATDSASDSAPVRSRKPKSKRAKPRARRPRGTSQSR